MACPCEQDPNYKKPENFEDRRSFLTKITFGIGAFIAAVLSFPLITAMLDPITRKKGHKWRKVGELADFEIGSMRMVSFENASPYQWSSKIAYSAAYIRRESEHEFTAFSVNCTHLGCPVRWVAKSELFLCPCHGGVYYKDGSRAAGPPPRGLYTYPIRVSDNDVEIETEAIPITTMDS